MNLKQIEPPEKIIEIALSRGRKRAASYKKQKTKFYTLKGKEIARIEGIYDYIEHLSERVKEFPSIDKMDPFYKDLMGFIVDINEIKIAMAKISSSMKIIKKLRSEKIVFLKELKFENGASDKAKKISNEFLGRTISLIKKLEKPIKTYNQAVSNLRELPSIKTDEEVFILAGFPNVGKSTLLKKISTSKPKIAAYPFTTQSLNVGTIIKKYIPIQIIDTPGLLDRKLSERNKIELKAISAFQHLEGTVIFVVDPMQNIKEQKNLLDEIKKLFNEKGFIVVINKLDEASEKEKEKALQEFEGNFIVEEGNEMNNLKEELLK